MEYAIDQPIVFSKWVCDSRGDREATLTGRIGGHAGDSFIVLLDHKLEDGTRALVVHSESVRPLSCHWCLDTQKVAVTPFTIEQYETGTIPQAACPYCAPSA